jgi:hypothetical protein
MKLDNVEGPCSSTVELFGFKNWSDLHGRIAVVFGIEESTTLLDLHLEGFKYCRWRSTTAQVEYIGPGIVLCDVKLGDRFKLNLIEGLNWEISEGFFGDLIAAIEVSRGYEVGQAPFPITWGMINGYTVRISGIIDKDNFNVYVEELGPRAKFEANIREFGKRLEKCCALTNPCAICKAETNEEKKSRGLVLVPGTRNYWVKPKR